MTTEEKEVKLPQPLRNDLIIENPLWGRMDIIEEELKLIPKAQQADYIKTNFNPLFKHVKVISIGANVQCTSAGKEVFVSPNSVEHGVYVDEEEKYVLISERDILAIW